MSGAEDRRLDYVVDASATIKLFVLESLSEQAETFFRSIAAQPTSHLYVPDLFFSECANILWKYVRRLGHPPAAARQDLANLRAMGWRSVSTRDLVADALEIAVAYGVTAYDACYVALAKRLALPLVTADEALVRKMAATSHDVRWLGDAALQPPTPERASLAANVRGQTSA